MDVAKSLAENDNCSENSKDERRAELQELCENNETSQFGGARPKQRKQNPTEEFKEKQDKKKDNKKANKFDQRNQKAESRKKSNLRRWEKKKESRGK